MDGCREDVLWCGACFLVFPRQTPHRFPPPPQDAFLERHGVKLGFMSAFVKAAGAALQYVPAVNGVIDGGDIIYREVCVWGCVWGGYVCVCAVRGPRGGVVWWRHVCGGGGGRGQEAALLLAPFSAPLLTPPPHLTPPHSPCTPPPPPPPPLPSIVLRHLGGGVHPQGPRRAGAAQRRPNELRRRGEGACVWGGGGGTGGAAVAMDGVWEGVSVEGERWARWVLLACT